MNLDNLDFKNFSDMFTIGHIACRREGVVFPTENALSAGKVGMEVHIAGEVCCLQLPCWVCYLFPDAVDKFIYVKFLKKYLHPKIIKRGLLLIRVIKKRKCWLSLQILSLTVL